MQSGLCRRYAAPCAHRQETYCVCFARTQRRTQHRREFHPLHRQPDSCFRLSQQEALPKIHRTLTIFLPTYCSLIRDAFCGKGRKTWNFRELGVHPTLALAYRMTAAQKGMSVRSQGQGHKCLHFSDTHTSRLQSRRISRCPGGPSDPSPSSAQTPAACTGDGLAAPVTTDIGEQEPGR